MDFPSITADNMYIFIIIFTKLRMTKISFQPTSSLGCTVYEGQMSGEAGIKNIHSNAEKNI